jgi:IS30 family transposase
MSRKEIVNDAVSRIRRAVRSPTEGAQLPRIAYSVREYARMVGRHPDAVRREIERKARREGDGVVADLALGTRAHKQPSAGRWSIVVPRHLVEQGEGS